MSNLPVPSRPAAAVSVPSQPVGSENSLATRLEARTMQIEPGLVVFRAGHGMTSNERSMARRDIFVIEGRLAAVIPPDDATIVAEISDQLFASFKARVSQSEDKVYDGFLLALTGRSEAAAREAVIRLLRNEAPARFSRTYVPTAAELAELAKEIEREWQLERNRLAWLLDRGEAPAVEAETAGFSQERMASLRAMNERLTAGAARAATQGSSPSGATSATARVAADLAERKAKNGSVGAKPLPDT